MLAMLSMIVLQAWHALSFVARDSNLNESRNSIASPMTATPKFGNVDYFSLSRGLEDRASPVSPTWSRFSPSPVLPPSAPSLSSSTSSRGSWSSLFHAGSMKQFMTGVQDTFKDGLATPLEIPWSSSGGSVTTPPNDKMARAPDAPLRKGWKGSPRYLSPPGSKSWNETLPPRPVSTFSSAGSRRPLNSRRNTGPSVLSEKRVLNAANTPNSTVLVHANHGKRILVFEEAPSDSEMSVSTST